MEIIVRERTYVGSTEGSGPNGPPGGPCTGPGNCQECKCSASNCGNNCEACKAAAVSGVGISEVSPLSGG